MNWPEVQQRWEQMHLVLRTYWTKLTTDDLQRINGNRAKLAEALQRRYGYQPEQAENAICAFEDDVRYPGAAK